MLQIILRERTAHLASYTIFTRDVDQYKNPSLSQLYEPPRTLFSQTMYHELLSSCEYGKAFTNSFFINLQKQSLQMFFKIRVFKKFCKLHRKALVLESLFKKTCKLKACNFVEKRLQHSCFPVRFTKFLKASFFNGTPPVTASAPPVSASVFFLKSN